ncbi:hypothetical protein Q8F55_008200 [Vanrija albida]|uniref:Uncharacterized protein n=1 Tax=Vanrija albida TaxID=181172 RepID=A0ABR3PVL4_9TREE
MSRRHSMLSLFRAEEDLSRFYIDPPKDHVDPKAVKKLPRHIQTSEDVYKCFRAYYGPRSGSYPVQVVLKYLEYKEHKARQSGDDIVNGVPTSVKHKLEVLEHMARGMNRSRVITNMVWPPKWAWDPMNKVVVPALPPPPAAPPAQPSLAIRKAEEALASASATDFTRSRRSTMRPTTYYDPTSTVDGDGRILTPSEILKLEKERNSSRSSLVSRTGFPTTPQTAGPETLAPSDSSREPSRGSRQTDSTGGSTTSSGLQAPVEQKVKKRGSRFFSFFGGGRSRSESNLAALASDPFASSPPKLSPPSGNQPRTRTPSTPGGLRTPTPSSPASSSLKVPTTPTMTPVPDRRASWVPATSSPLAKRRFAPTLPSAVDEGGRTESMAGPPTARSILHAPGSVSPQEAFGAVTPKRNVTTPGRFQDPSGPSFAAAVADPEGSYALPRVAHAADLDVESITHPDDPPVAPIPMSREAAYVRDQYAAATAATQASRGQPDAGAAPRRQGGDVFGPPLVPATAKQPRSRQSVGPRVVLGPDQQAQNGISTAPQAPSTSPPPPLYPSRRTPSALPGHMQQSSESMASVRSEPRWSFLKSTGFLPEASKAEPPSPSGTARLAYDESSQGHGRHRSSLASASDIPPVPPLPPSIPFPVTAPAVPGVQGVPRLVRSASNAGATPLSIPNSLPVTPDSPRSPSSPLQYAHQRKPRPVLHIDIPNKVTVAPRVLPSVPGTADTVTAVQKPFPEADADRTAVEHPADANAGYAGVLLYSRLPRA